MNFENDKPAKLHKLAVNRKMRDFLKEESRDIQIAVCEILEYMFANNLQQMNLTEFLSLNNEFCKEIAPLKDQLPEFYNLEELDLIDNHRELSHIKMALKRKIAPVVKMTPMGVLSLVNEMNMNHLQSVAVVSDDVVYSEELAYVSDNVTHYFMNQDDDFYASRKICLLGMTLNNSGKLRSTGKLTLGKDFFAEKSRKYSVIVICSQQENDSAFINKAEELLFDDGMIVYCVSPKALTSNEYADFRKDYIAAGAIQNIFELKSASGSPVFAAIVISKSQNKALKFICVENIIPSYRKPENGKSVVCEISYDDLKKIGSHNLMPDYFINNNPLEKKNNENYRLLSDVVEITRGSYTSTNKIQDRYTTEKTGIRYLAGSGIENNCIKNNLPYLTEIAPMEEKYVVSKGDFVLAKVANPIRFAEIKTDEKILTSVNMYILRPKPEVMLPEYLRAYFESEEGQQQLRSIARGDKTISVLEVKELKNMMIPCPELNEQSAFIEKLQKLEAEEKLLEEKLSELRNHKESLFKELLSE